MTRHLRGRVGTSTVPDRTDTRSRYALMTDSAYERQPFVRCLDYPCPTCQEPAAEGCRAISGKLLPEGRAHKKRLDLLWSQPCPECGAKVGEHCTGREKGVNHDVRDAATAEAVPGSQYIPPVRLSRRELAASLERFRALVAEGKAPWQQPQQ